MNCIKIVFKRLEHDTFSVLFIPILKMAMSFPLMKLASMAIKRVSKPLANAAKRKAKQSPFFRNYICLPPANFYHWCEVKVTMMSKNLTGKEVKLVPALSEKKAIELGASLVGEAVIFMVGSSIFILEYFRRSHNRSIKDMKSAEQMKLVLQDLKALFLAKAELEQKVEALAKFIETELNVVVDHGAFDIEGAIPEHHIDPETAPEMEESLLENPQALVFNALDYIEKRF